MTSKPEVKPGQKSAWEKSGVCWTPSAPDLLEARFWTASRLFPLATTRKRCSTTRIRRRC